MNKDNLNKIILDYDTTQIIDNSDFQIINENLDQYLKKEAEYLKENNIEVLNINFENQEIEINPDDKDKIKGSMYQKIPFILSDFTNINKEKNVNISDNKKYNKQIKIILDYFKKNDIHYSQVKENFIEYACSLCKKHLENKFKCIIFFNSFHTISMSKTDCIDNKHIKYFKKMQTELKALYKNSLDLDKEFVNWNPDYSFAEIGTGKDKIIITMKEYWNKFSKKDKSERPEFKLKVILCKQNIIRLLKHYDIEIKFNLISKKYNVFLNGKLDNFPLDYWIKEIINYIDIRKLHSDKSKIEGILTNIGFENQYNPIEEKFKNMRNSFDYESNNKEFKKLCNCITTCSGNKEDKLFTFLLQLCYLICRPEYENLSLHAEFLLLLLGLQGSGKTTFARKLSPDSNYFLEANTVDITNKDIQLRFASHCLIEIGELGSTYRKNDRDSFKAYNTAAMDKIRPPYGKEDINFPRRFCMIGTTNDNTILNDPTGSRRYLVLNDCKINLEELKKIDINKVWIYIYDRYLAGIKFHWDFDKLQELQKENKQVTFKSDRLIILETYFDLTPDNDKTYKLKHCWEHFYKNADKDEIDLIKTKMILKKEFLKANIKTIYNTRYKVDEYLIDLKSDSPAKSELPPKDNIIEFKNEKPEKKDL